MAENKPLETTEVRGRYGYYKNVSIERAQAYYAFLQTPEGKAWIDGTRYEMRVWDRNWYNSRAKPGMEVRL
jgi:hypothetical protein